MSDPKLFDPAHHRQTGDSCQRGLQEIATTTMQVRQSIGAIEQSIRSSNQQFVDSHADSCRRYTDKVRRAGGRTP